MKKLIAAAAVAAFGFVGAASAADLPTKGPAYAPAYAPAPFSWTGPYLGLNLGWARAEVDGNNTTDLGGFFLPVNVAGINAAGGFSSSDNAFTGGVQIGYNWQTSIWVLGLEGDFNVMDVKSSSTLIIPYSSLPVNGTRIDNEVKTNWLATVRGRLGVAAFNDGRALFYVTGGAAFANVKLSTATFEVVPIPTINCGVFHCGASSTDTTRVGWTVGGGLEWALNRNWSLKGEYLFADLGDVTTDTIHNGANVPAVPSVIHTSANLNLHIARAGINYRF